MAHLVGLQAQDEWVAAYAVRPRAAKTVTAQQVTQSRELICTWVMRGTLHLVAAQDARWLVELLGPRFLSKQRGRRHQLGLTDELIKEALPVIRELGPATRAEIVAAARNQGLDVAAGQAEAYLVATAAMHGLIHRRGKVYEPLPDGGDRPEDPLAELAKRYLAGHAPAEPEDFAAWSGLSLTEARQGFSKLDRPSTVDSPVPGIKLLGHFDPLLLGYRDRGFILNPKHAKQIQRGGGFLQPIVVVDGEVRGTWRREIKGDRLSIAVESFGGPIPDWDKEADDLKRFLGLR
ncbi:hypothetical protein Rhe02_89730 [Rhizocola hellebori]|uniref:Winged helix DNA-binding domain-containing protein n=1 Tax=Rhizocola hellebori TaxID=1392758 RepID=A0A8J3QHU0_9ACTN|nr:hypothetical protein Rhe02_89730 [Rhizocola hellebori]